MGRYLIDVPVEMGNFGVSSQFLYGLDARFKTVEVVVDSADFTPDQFMRKTNARIDELNSKQNNDLKIPLLLAQEVWNTPHGKALMLRYLKRDYTTYTPVISELHMLVGSRYAVAAGTTYDDEKDIRKTDRQTYKFIDPQPLEDRLRVIAQNIKGYSDATQAPEGFCMAGVVMNDKTMGYDVETGGFGVQADEKLLPDTTFHIRMQGQYGHEEENLLQRVDRVNPGVRAVLATQGAQLFVLRKGDRAINGMPGMEYAEAIHVTRSDVGFMMRAQTNLPKEKQSLQRPYIEFLLSLGQDKPSSLDQTQAMKVWDTLLDTMRLSPANGGRQIDPKTGGLVPPTKVGQTCPRSGLWEACLPATHPEANHLAGLPQTFRIKSVQAGEPMPEFYARFMFPDTAEAGNAAIAWRWLREG
ncbi:MAG: hypothetical protein EOP13_31145 [Pseudomonas sp.]|nr:MAG: hypothetical protein EOP13_31145 [Pseudomonas sp.]